MERLKCLPKNLSMQTCKKPKNPLFCTAFVVYYWCSVFVARNGSVPGSVYLMGETAFEPAGSTVTKIREARRFPNMR